MKRSRPRQHVRRMKGGKQVIINRGVMKNRNYGSVVSFGNKSEFDKVSQDSHRIAGGRLKQLGEETDELLRKNDNLRSLISSLPEASRGLWEGQLRENELLVERNKRVMVSINDKFFPSNRRNYGGFNLIVNQPGDITDSLYNQSLLGRLLPVKRVAPNYGSFFHGTSEESLAKMPLTGGLKPSRGKLYLSDDPKYARLKARQAVSGTLFKPVVLVVDDPGDLEREGRHYVSKKTIPLNSFKRVDV